MRLRLHAGTCRKFRDGDKVQVLEGLKRERARSPGVPVYCLGLKTETPGNGYICFIRPTPTATPHYEYFAVSAHGVWFRHRVSDSLDRMLSIGGRMTCLRFWVHCDNTRHCPLLCAAVILLLQQEHTHLMIRGSDDRHAMRSCSLLHTTRRHLQILFGETAAELPGSLSVPHQCCCMRCRTATLSRCWASSSATLQPMRPSGRTRHLAWATIPRNWLLHSRLQMATPLYPCRQVRLCLALALLQQWAHHQLQAWPLTRLLVSMCWLPLPSMYVRPCFVTCTGLQ